VQIINRQRLGDGDGPRVEEIQTWDIRSGGNPEKKSLISHW
jgi:hypothetical protein